MKGPRPHGRGCVGKEHLGDLGVELPSSVEASQPVLLKPPAFLDVNMYFLAINSYDFQWGPPILRCPNLGRVIVVPYIQIQESISLQADPGIAHWGYRQGPGAKHEPQVRLRQLLPAQSAKAEAEAGEEQ